MRSSILIITSLFFLLFFSCTTITESKNMIQRELSEGWKYHQVNGDIMGLATVPGVIHTDLLNEGKIEDPFYRTNEKDLQWIDKEDWEYKTTFNISKEELGKDNLILSFQGLDTYADVFLNDTQILQADNMFRTWEVNILQEAQIGDNELRVYFHSPINKGLELLEKEGHAYPANNDQSENGGLGDKKVSIFTRKAGYHYGWDWGPRFVTSGIWKPIELKAWNNLRIKNTYIKQPQVSKEKAELVADVTLEISDEAFDGRIIVSNERKILAIETVQLAKGTKTISIPFTIENPKLWWSNGLGEAHLYDFTIEVVSKKTVLAKEQLKTGLRDLKLVREKDKDGETFQFELNGQPVFAKGANYIPNDLFLPRVTKEDYEKVIADAVNANMNMLRVWGGGIYENDYFYELCDQNGIMVWQDFMFACSMYPGDPKFLESIKHEAIDNVTRLRNHPSIALWCGNNEINTGWHYYGEGGWGWKQRYSEEIQTKINNTYLTIFHDILANVVDQYTLNDTYWPSSPQAGYNVEQHAGMSSVSGDVHYWGVWHGLHPFEDFDVYKARFMSEYGFQSFPDFETVQTYTIPEDYDIESEVMAAHQRSGIGNLRIKEYMSWYFNVPSKFDDFLYMSHVLQAYGMRKGIEAHRRAMPFCMGTLYWQINDCWPVASWSSTDYLRKWKAMHYEVKRAFEPTLLSGFQDNNKFEIYGITDQLESIEGTLKLSYINFNGSIRSEEELNTKLEANTSTPIYAVKNINSKIDTSRFFLKAQLFQGEKLIARSNFFFAQPKNQKLLQPRIKTQVLEKDEKWYVEIETDNLARYILLNIPNQNEFFVDNYFDLTPGEKRLIEIQNYNPEEQSKIEITHLQLIQPK